MAENTMRQEKSPIKINQMATSGSRVPRVPELPIDPGIGKVIGPTKEEAADANAGKYAPKGVAKVLEKWKAGVVGAAAVAGSVAAYEMNPGIHRLVDEQFLERIGVNTKEIGPTFDNSKVRHLIGENNISRVSQEEVQARSGFEPKFNREANTLEYLFPFKLPEGVTANFDKTSRARDGSGTESPRIKFSDAGVEIVAPADSYVELQRGSEENGGVDSNLGAWLTFYHYDPVQDTTTVWTFASEANGKMVGFEPLHPMINSRDRGRWEQLPTAEAGTSIVRTIDREQVVSFGSRVYKGKLYGDAGVYTSTRFTTNSDGRLTVLAPTHQENVASAK